MNRPMLKRVFPQVLVWAAVVALSGPMTLAQDSNPAMEQAAGQRSDGQIEMDVVHALDASKALKDDMITAATIQSEVTLSGTVATLASSELAESIAGHVQGVIKVHNNLQVGNPQAAQDSLDADANAQQMATDAPPDSEAESASAYAPGGTDEPLPVPSQAQDQTQDQASDQSQIQTQTQKSAPQLPSAQPQYAPVQPPASVYEALRGTVTIAPGTLLQVRTNESVSSKHAKDGMPVEFTVIRDVTFGGVLAIPRGATVHGVVTESRKAGDLGGSAMLALKLTSLDLGGQSYALDSDQFKVKGPNKAGQTVSNAVGGAILGTIIGCSVGRGPGCAIGAAAGAGAGTAASAATPGPGVWIPAEALVDFHLAAPLTVTPVSAQEAARLAQGLYQGGPTLYQRGRTPYGRPYNNYPYGYPPVYFRPYYVVGGFYYWR